MISPKYKLDIDYEALLGKAWVRALNPLLISEYMTNLMYFINESYKVQRISPNKIRVFDSFFYCPITDLQVVILGKEPYFTSHATGLAFGNDDKVGQNFSPELVKILETIEEQINNGLRINMEPTLEFWEYAGVLLLNSALTVQDGKPGSHLEYWRNFTREVIKTISKNKTNIIFCLWGEEAQYFKQYINEDKHFIFECESPTKAVEEDRKWNCNHFVEINKLIAKINGPDCCIPW